MKLDHLVLVNWGQLNPGNYALGNMTLLTGPTGAGKSTMLDGLQTVMTAAYQGIVAYNPGQEEVQAGQRRGKSKRTLESFVAGAELSRFSRPDGAHAYMIGVFRPGPDEPSAKMFSALVGAAARVDGATDRRDAKLERLVLVIVEDVALSVEDCFDDIEQGVCVPVQNIVKQLRAKYPKVTNYEDHKRDYLCGLYGRFRGRHSIPWDEAQNAAKAWTQSIAYRPIGSVHDLVREDILEFDAKQLQESITRISDLMRQVTNLKQEGKRLEDTVYRLHHLKEHIGATAVAFEEQVQLDLLFAKMQLAEDEARIALEQNRIHKDQKLAQQNQQKTETEAALKKAVDNSRIDIATQLGGNVIHTEKKALDEQLARATSSARNTLRALHSGLIAAANIKNAADHIVGQIVSERFSKLHKAVEAVAQAIAHTDMDRLGGLLNALADADQNATIAVEKLFQLAGAFDGIETGLEALLTTLVGTEASVLMAIASESADLEQQLNIVRQEQRECAEHKKRLVAGAGNYPREINQALDRIREDIPEARVQVLCDLVEPVTEEWQPAIEGYLGGARFNLIVQPECEAKTIDFLQSLHSRAKVVQGKRCVDRASENRVAADSIIHELRTDHPIARAYLMEQFGSVVKVADSNELRFISRGLTKDGKGSGAMTMFVCEKHDLVLGRKARADALAKTNAQLDSLDRDLEELERLKTHLRTFKQYLNNLKQPTFDAQPLEEYAKDIDHARRALSQLDLTEVEPLRAELARLEQVIKAHDEAIKLANTTMALAQEHIEQAKKSIEALSNGRDARLQECARQAQRLQYLCEVNAEKTYAVLAQDVEDLFASKHYTFQTLQARLTTLRARPNTLLGDVREILAEYNSSVRHEERFQFVLPHLLETMLFDPYYGPLVHLGSEVHRLHSTLESVGLYNNRAKVEEAERSFHDVFTKQFCVEIKSKVDEGVRALRQLNFELEKLKFGTDRYSIDWSKWEPEFQEYYGFFCAVTELADSPETIDLFGQTELSPKHLEVRDRLVKLLLDQDAERAGRELLRIADYRNYRRYEIWNDSDSGGRIALSTWGTGSGGQLETPAYIVRAAVVTNRMKLFEKGASLKLLVSDESFSKMDEPRARAVLQYLRDSLGLQVISAMPTRNVGGLRPEFDREYNYSRVHVEANGELDFILESDGRIFKQDAMRALWEKQRDEVRQQAKLAFDIADPLEVAPPQ